MSPPDESPNLGVVSYDPTDKSKCVDVVKWCLNKSKFSNPEKLKVTFKLKLYF